MIFILISNQSIEIIDNNKNNEIKLEENKKKVKFLNNFKKLSTKTNLSYFSNKRESYNSLGSNKKGSQKESTINPIKISKLKNIMNLNKNIDDLKKNETIKSKRKSLYISKALKANVNFKFLKEQLKNSVIIRPEETGSFPKYRTFKTLKDDENNNNIINCKTNNFKLLFNQRKSEIGKRNRYKSVDFGIVKHFNYGLKNEINNNKDISNKKLSQKGLKTEGGETTKDFIRNLSITKGEKRKSIHKIDKFRILDHKPNLYDSLDDEELEDEEEVNTLFIDPNSSFSFYFDLILFCFTILSFIEIPLYLAINRESCKDVNFSFNSLLNYFIDILNIADLFLGFFRAYYNWEENLITKKKNITFHYLTGWFFLDLLSFVPVFTIIQFYEKACNKEELYSEYYNVISNNNHYLFIFNKVFKVMKVFLNNQAWNIISNKINERWNIIITIFLVLSSINYTACMYIFIARNSYPNWIFQAKLNSTSFIDIYIAAIYIIIMALTTVGYGDITCYSFYEYIFQLLILNIGIIGYTWVVSFISNYIQKINEKSVEFKKKIAILDEIKRDNPNLHEDLYDRIVRHLKFNDGNEININNTLFDSIPLGLKNSLISEMYKPIIKNFIFFKNFQNLDFIVRVIMAFKPIVAYKNDILVNEGDMVEDIIFVKKGLLALELVINMDNPQENIKKYNLDNRLSLESLGNSFLFKNNNGDYANVLNLYNINGQDLQETKDLYNSSAILKELTLNKYSSKKIYKKNLEEVELKQKKNLIYVKIILLRENEHFGDVLMFLERKSPLRVRVRSKKSELFFLKKMDAINISASHQNLWKRINKKSIYNFEQMQKTIYKIVEIYCSVKKNNSKKNSSITINKKKMRQEINKSNNNNSIIVTSPKNENKNVKKRGSVKKSKINDEKLELEGKMNKNNIKNNKEILEVDFNNIDNTRNLVFSSSSLSSSPSNSRPSSSLNIINNISKKNSKKENDKNSKKKKKKKNYDTKVIKAFEGNYKFYKRIGKNINKKASIISEEETFHHKNIENSFKGILKKPSNKKKNSSNLKNKHSNFEINLDNDENSDKSNKNKSDSNSSYLKEINDELKPDEVIELNKEETLLCKKIDFNDNSAKTNFELNNDLIYKNNKVKKLLKYLKDVDDNISLNKKYIDNNNKDKIINVNEKQKSKEKNKNKLDDNKNNFINLGNSINKQSSNIYNPNEKIIKGWNSNLFINKLFFSIILFLYI